MTNFLITILVGGIAGWLADMAFKKFSLSLFVQIILGIIGAYVGSWILGGELQTMLGFPELLSRIIEAFIGAVVVLFVVGFVKGLTNK